MSDLSKKVMLHFIETKKTGKCVLKAVQCFVPRINDEIRLRSSFYKVKRVVWVYDEPKSVYSRVNIGVKKV